MEKPALEIRVEAIGGAGINRTSLQMTNLARATDCVVICEFQPGVILQAKPGDAAVDVARQLPGYDGDEDEQVYATRTINPGQEIRKRPGRWLRISEPEIEAVREKLESMQDATTEIRRQFIEWGGR